MVETEKGWSFWLSFKMAGKGPKLLSTYFRSTTLNWKMSLVILKTGCVFSPFIVAKQMKMKMEMRMNIMWGSTRYCFIWMTFVLLVEEDPYDTCFRASQQQQILAECMGVQVGLQLGQGTVSICWSNCTLVLLLLAYKSIQFRFFSCYKEKAWSIKDSFLLQTLGLFTMHIGIT